MNASRTEENDTASINKQELVKLWLRAPKINLGRGKIDLGALETNFLESYVSTPKKEAAVEMTPKKEKNVKPQVLVKKEATVQATAGEMKAAKSEKKDTVIVNEQEPVKVNVVAGLVLVRNYVVLSNIYAERCKWYKVENVRVLKKENSIKKAPGQSMVG
ncbi:hypothetical protein LguiB_021524 [Lonicera macranthoides]